MSDKREDVVVAPIPVSVGDREIKMLPPDLSQVALIQHQVRVLERDNVTPDVMMRALDMVFRICLGRVVEQTDKEYVEELLADGALELQGLVKALMEAFKAAHQDEEPPKPRVRRGRPRKNAA